MANKKLAAVTSLLGACLAVVGLLMTLAVPPVLAGDPDMLQDICVADYKSLQGPLRLNGFPCKKPETVTANDFFSAALSLAGGNTSTAATAVTTWANVQTLPGLNTLGVSVSRTDYAPRGVSPPHVHPRATEVIFVLQGSLDVGFVTGNRLFARTVCAGEVFVFPRSLVHYQRNSGGGGPAPAAALSAFDSQFPGTENVAEALFGASPPFPTDVLARSFQVDEGLVETIKSRFPPKY